MKIGIISLGLIGGSLFKALDRTEHEVYAVTRNKDTITKALKHTPNVSNDISILKTCDIVFVASPINKVLNVLDSLEDVVSSECIVLDCSSVKEFVMQKSRPYKFIGSHPMAGTENSGYEASFRDLFIGAKWVLTPSKDIKEEDIIKIEKVIYQTGATPIIADAKDHDKAVSLISHMPLLLAQALFNSVKDNKLALKLASSGFRDMTRLATSNLEMAHDMREYNNENIHNSIEELIKSLQDLEKTKDEKVFADIKNIRTSMYSSEGKNIL